MSERNPDVSVVVLNYNGSRWLERCFAAVETQQGVSCEAILVDNASTDDSVELVARRFPRVRIVRLAANRGFAGGNNAGAREARAPFLAFLNNDTEADIGWAAALHGALVARPAAGLTTSRIVSLADGVTVDSAGDGYLRAGGAFKRGHGEPDAAYREPADVFGACGAAFMIRRALFEEIGGFDEDLFLVYEDVDLSYRARLAGHRCLYVPGALVHHAGSATLGRLSRQALYFGQRNLEWVYVTNTPGPLLLRTLPAHVAYSLAGGVYLASVGHFGTWLSAKWAALAGLRGALRKRSHVQRGRRATVAELEAVMESGWVRRKWREKRPAAAPGSPR
jgi:GT2 family glycosyltransferase